MRSHVKTSVIVGATLLSLVGLLFSRTAHADNPAPRQISAQAVKIHAKAETLDTNGDGWLDDNETSKGRASLGVLYDAVHARVDLNGDGRVSVREYAQAQIEALHQADRNTDGWIDAEEARQQKRQLIGELLRGR